MWGWIYNQESILFLFPTCAMCSDLFCMFRREFRAFIYFELSEAFDCLSCLPPPLDRPKLLDNRLPPPLGRPKLLDNRLAKPLGRLRLLDKPKLLDTSLLTPLDRPKLQVTYLPLQLDNARQMEANLMPGPATPGAAAELQPTTPPLQLLQPTTTPEPQARPLSPTLLRPRKRPRCIAQLLMAAWMTRKSLQMKRRSLQMMRPPTMLNGWV